MRPLEALLIRLGYRCSQGVWNHPSRQAIFLGDFIDRGPHQRDVLGIVRPMIEHGSALAVMGNHEFNAVCYATVGTDGAYLRRHSAKNNIQHRVFTDAYADPWEWREVIEWFRQLPLWLDLPEGVRVIHACWDAAAIDRVTARYGGPHGLAEASMLEAAARPGTWEFEAIENVLKGKEVTLPRGQSFLDKDGTRRHQIRVCWWDIGPTTYRGAFLGPESQRTHIPEDPIGTDHLIVYRHDAPPVFVGHYWFRGTPKRLAPNIACLDYSVAAGGPLVAYRWDGESILDNEKFVSHAAGKA